MKSHNEKKWRPGARFWFVLYGVLVLTGLFIGSWYFKNGADRAKFWVEGLLSAAVLSVVAIQAYIYRKQWHVMERQFIHSERAYVGIHSIKQGPAPYSDTMNLRIENTGRLPADWVSVKIDLILLIPEDVVKKSGNVLQRESAGSWWLTYRQTKLFRGNLHFQIPVPLNDWFRPLALIEVYAGNARLIAQIRINYKDGLGNPDRSDYAFRFEAQGGEWMAWPVWSDEDMERRIAEARSNYQPH